ncbi:putative methyltransferase-like protein 15 [Armadillidium vulgare]|nr:putative methyltransferase-like protein 15 [Armadillidium vulgare]
MFQRLNFNLKKYCKFCYRNYSVFKNLYKDVKPHKREFIKICQKYYYCISVHEMHKDKYKSHTPVLAKEAVNALNVNENGIYLDMTFGAGGHSEAILENFSNVVVYALDRDPETKKFSEELKQKYPSRFHYMLGKFSDLSDLLSQKGISGNFFNGVLMDLGVSSMQFDTPSRGFMLSQNGPLDMRMGGISDEDTPSAAQILSHIDELSLYKVLKYYGQEKRARLIARGIIESRILFKSLKTTKELAQLVESLALRILVNDELNQLDYGIRVAHYYLQPSGILAAISFHSLEDTILKRHITGHGLDKTPDSIGQAIWKSSLNHMKTYSQNELSEGILKPWNSHLKHVLVPSPEEMEDNPRSRSAKMRVASKISCQPY